jgi:glycosyltransferase involved in cell wall biosynthesis
MRIAFYAPMKPPDHPVPSGDRHMARLFQQAFERAGHQIELACRLRSRDPQGDPQRQARLQKLGDALADRILRRWETRPEGQRPQAWFTYHLYYKAPDWVGPSVCRRLGIPYLVAEASVAYKRAGGPWDLGHRATLDALACAAAVITVNPHDTACLPEGSPVVALKPFLDSARFRLTAEEKATAKTNLAARAGLDRSQPWLLSVAMMRRGDKLASYRLLAETMTRLQDRPWQLLIVGDGPARAEVEAAFSGTDPARLHFLGECGPDTLREIYAAGDLFVWPAVNEAYGMALLEAQTAGLPVIAGRTGGVPAIVEDGVTGLLTLPENCDAFTAALKGLLADPRRRHDMAAAAAEKTAEQHDLSTASKTLDAILQQVREAAPLQKARS